MTKVHTYVTLKTGNRKTGPLAATYRSQTSCPTSCPMNGEGCYASGRIFAVSTRYGQTDDVQAVRDLARQEVPIGIRFNVSGDFLGVDGEPDWNYISACNEAADAHRGKLIISYTHAWRQLTPEAFSFTVNASCETEQEVLEAQAAGWQTVITGSELESIGSSRVVTCLEQTGQSPNCAECGLCGVDKRTRPIVNFRLHGTGQKRAAAAIAAKHS